jgi:hypothetical protein
MKKIILFFLINISFARAQSPGGVSANLNLWIKANAGVATSSGNVLTWLDQSPNGYTYTSAAIKPTLTTDGLNYNYVVTFPGNQNIISTTDVSYADWTAYFVVKGVDGALSSSLLANSSRSIKYEQYNNTAKYGYTAFGVSDYASTISCAFSTPEILQVDHLSSTNNVNFYSQYGGAISSSVVNCAATDRKGVIYSLGGGDTDFFTGYMAEVIMYNTQITSAATKNAIESYLAIKYGIEKNQLTDYVASDGTTKMWNSAAANAATYKYDIAGIGRDNTSGLGQIKSKSSNADGLLTISADGEGTNYVPSYVDMANLEFLTYGNNNGVVAWTATGAPTGYQLSSRQWLAQETGDVGNCTFAFDVANATFNIPAPVQPNGYYIIYDTDADGLLSDETPTQLYDDGTNGDVTAGDNVYSRSGINISNGAFFTIATTTNSPGGVSANLNLWIKANAGVSTSGSNVLTWSDHSPNAYTYTSSAIKPTLTTDGLNYNYVVTFPGNQNIISTTDVSYADWTAYFVVRGTDANASSMLLGNASRGIKYEQYNNTAKYGYTAFTVSDYASTISCAYGSPEILQMDHLSSSTNVNFYNQYGGALSSSVVNCGATDRKGPIYSLGGGDGDFFNGYMAEVIMYNTQITSAATKNTIESYLAIKYGIEKNQLTDYVASDGTTKMWNSAAANAATYKYDIAGIGRDDASGLGQIKSKSSNADGLLTISADGEGTNYVPGYVDMANLEFLTYGNNNGVVAWTATGAPTGYQLSSRQWLAQETGDVGNCTFAFDVANATFNIPAPIQPNGYYIIYDTDADGLLSDETPTQLYDDGTNGDVTAGDNVYSRSGINISNGTLFTIATATTLVYAPGGVSSNLKLWLRANYGVTGTTNVTAWDGFVNGFNATATTGPALQTNDINFNPSLQFDGSTKSMSISGGIMGAVTYNDANVYTVGRVNAVSASFLFNEPLASAGRFSSHIPWSTSAVYWDAGNTVAPNRITVAWGGATNTNYLWTLNNGTTAGITPFGHNQDIARDGLNLINDNTAAAFTGNNSNFTIGYDGAGNFYNANIGELIVYTGAITPQEQQRIHSYLALKYGITLTNNNDADGITNETISGSVKEGDYVASDGSTIFWNYSTNPTYHNSVAGIGRDDASGLSQLKSKSAYAASVLTISAASFSTNKDFLTWGHNNGTATWTFTGAPASYKILNRLWIAQKVLAGSSAINSCVVAFDVANATFNIPGPIQPNGYYLIYDTDVDGLLSDETPIQLYDDGTNGDVTASDNVYSRSGINIPNGALFTIATSTILPYAPGGVSSNLKLWLRANYGVTGTTNVTAWDGFVNGFNATATTGPALQTNDINYNPSLQFNGSTKSMSIPGGIMGIDTYADANVYTVGRVNAVSSSYFFNEAVASAGRVCTTIPYSDNSAYWDAGIVPGSNRLTVAWGGAVNTNYLWTFNFGTTAGITPFAHNQDIARDGLNIANDNTAVAFTGNNSNFNIAYDGTGNYYNANVGELAVYTGAITALEQQRIQSYLALKYGITLTNNNDADATANETISGSVKEGDYVASDGSTIFWNYSTNPTYHNSVAGIGRDDASGLSQLRSKSAYAASVLTLSAASFSTNKDFLTWGHNNGTATWTATGAPASYKILNRLWIAQKVLAGSSAITSCVVAFDVANTSFNIPPFIGSNGYYLIYDTDVDGLLSDETPIPLFDDGTNGDVTANDNVYSKGGINVPNGALFTIATGTTINYGPGGVTNGLKLWLRGNYRTVGTTNVITWDDFASGFSPTATTGPALQTTDINFNPTLQFDGSTKSMSISGGIMGTGTYTDANVYTVGHVNSVSASFLFGEALASGGRFSSHVPWSDNNLYWDAGNTAAPNRLNIAWGGAINTNYLWTLNSGSTAGITPFGHNQDIARDGLNIANDNTAAAFTGNNSNFTIGYDGAGNFYNANVGELAIYTSAITPLEQQRIHSYLALKYGIALTNNNDADLTLNETISGSVKEGDYVASDGSTLLWTYAANASYSTNVAGIGRDDNSGLDQRISTSTASTADIIQVSLDNNFTAANNSASRTTTFATDKIFLLWGHNNGATTFSTVEGTGNRMTRLWKQQKIGTVNSVYVKFTSAAISNSTTYYLIGSNTGAAGSFATLTSATSAGAGNTITFGPVDLTRRTFFTLSSDNGPLPIELLNFSAAVNSEKTVDLKWTTASEKNNDFFTLEKSKEGAVYKEITKVKGAGNSSSVLHYSSVDPDPFFGVSYYRLKQTDYDGTFSYSKSVFINIDKEDEFSIRIVPNPFSSETTLLSGKNFKDAILTVYNSFGQQVKQIKNISGQTITLYRDNLASGLYFIQVTEGDQLFTAGKLMITD